MLHKLSYVTNVVRDNYYLCSTRISKHGSTCHSGETDPFGLFMLQRLCKESSDVPHRDNFEFFKVKPMELEEYGLLMKNFRRRTMEILTSWKHRKKLGLIE